MQQVTTLGIDIAKNVFQLHGVNARGKTVLQKRLSRNKVLAFIAKLPACLIGMEASGGSHYWAREFSHLGHEVKLMAPQFVKPYIQGNKNDANDAAAICEAVSRPRMRFVPIKTVVQQDMQALHRIRERQIKMRTALVNQIRGLLSEYGIVMPKGIAQVRHKLPFILEDADNSLSEIACEWLQSLQVELRRMDEQIDATTHKIEQMFTSPLSVFKPAVPRPWRPEPPSTLPDPILRHLSRWRIAVPRLAVRCCGRPPLRAGGAAGGASDKPLPARGSGRTRGVLRVAPERSRR